jgi:hypothetical protein
MLRISVLISNKFGVERPFGWLNCMNVDDDTAVSDVNTASIFRVEYLRWLKKYMQQETSRVLVRSPGLYRPVAL